LCILPNTPCVWGSNIWVLFAKCNRFIVICVMSNKREIKRRTHQDWRSMCVKVMVFNATFNNISLYTHLHITAYLTTYVTLFGCCRSAYCRIHGSFLSNGIAESIFTGIVISGDWLYRLRDGRDNMLVVNPLHSNSFDI
jgi:hypothetical protein